MIINFAAYFTQNNVPATGLTPTITIINVSDETTEVTDASMTELGLGWYKYEWSSTDLTKDYVARADGGVTLSDGERYAPCTGDPKPSLILKWLQNRLTKNIGAGEYTLYDNDKTTAIATGKYSSTERLPD